MNQLLIPQDKANHIVYGALFYLAVFFACTQLAFADARFIAMLATLALGALKEGLDAILNHRAEAAGLPPPHGVEFLDFAATSCGGLVCFLSASI